jgi:Tfp pilus assembly protein PilO
MAFTDSGWMRRFRVPRLAVTLAAALLVALTVATILSVSFAVWAGADLRRLTAVERENRSLTTQLQDQAGQLTRLQVEMSRLRELERNLRAVSGLTGQAEAGERTGKGGGLPPALPR